MSGFFSQMGRMLGGNLRKASWMAASLAGTEADSLAAEQRVGQDLALAFLKECPLDPDPRAVEFLAEMHDLLTAPLAGRPWKFAFRSVLAGECNAFAFPGGYIFVSRPLLSLCGADAHEMAFVLGHEMGHIAHRHAIDRVMASTALNTALSRLPMGGILGGSLVSLASTLVSQGYSQEQELQADDFGVRLARSAGFDPQGAVRLLDRLAGVHGELAGLSRYFASHPPFEIRIAGIHRALREG